MLRAKHKSQGMIGAAGVAALLALTLFNAAIMCAAVVSAVGPAHPCCPKSSNPLNCARLGCLTPSPVVLTSAAAASPDAIEVAYAPVATETAIPGQVARGTSVLISDRCIGDHRLRL